VQQGLTAICDQEAELFRRVFLGWLAEAYAQAGNVDAGLRLMHQALAAVDENCLRLYETDLHRLNGEMLRVRSPDNPAAAEACFYKALGVARRQQGKS
jgi:hypothetical protein